MKRNKVGDGSGTLLMLGFESADHPVETWFNRALECCNDHGGTTPNGVVIRGGGEAAGRGGSVGDWRDAFIRMPYHARSHGNDGGDFRYGRDGHSLEPVCRVSCWSDAINAKGA